MREPFSFASLLPSLWKNVQRALSINEPFPDSRFYLLETVLLETALIFFSLISEHWRLEVREVWLYKKKHDAAVQEFLVFGVHDIEANDPSTPISFIRVDHVGVQTKDEDTAGRATSSVVATGNVTIQDLIGATGLDSHGDAPATSLRRNDYKDSKVLSSFSSGSTYSPTHREAGDDTYLMALSLDALLGQGDEENHELTVKFSQHMDPMYLLVLASSIKDVPLEHGAQSQNCHFFSRMVVELSVDVLGGKAEPSRKNKSGKAGDVFALSFLADAEFENLYKGAKIRYEQKWAEFQKDRERFAFDPVKIAKEREKSAQVTQELNQKLDKASEELKQERAMREDLERRAAELEAAGDLAKPHAQIEA